MKRSISIINTEIQLINVIEAIQHFECQDNYLVIGQFNIRLDRIHKIEKMLEEPTFKQHFKKIIHLPLYLSNKNPLRFMGYILAYIKFFFLILFSKKFDCCFFGVVTDIIVKPVVYLTHYKNRNCMLCVIDEGVRVMADANDRVQNESQLLLQQKKKIGLLHGFFLAISRKWIYPALTYFSIYPLPLLEHDILIKNQYDFLRNHPLDLIKLEKNSIVIVGQPCAELKITTLEVYKRIVLQFISQHPDCQIYYAPHPIETDCYQWMPDQVTLLKTKYPLELLIISNTVKTLIGFNSTVLFNCAVMGICQEIYSVSLDKTDYLTLPDPDTINRLYHQLREFGVIIVNSHFVPLD